MVYEHLVNTGTPRVIPQSEGNAQDSISSIGRRTYGENDPFGNEAASDSRVMGQAVSKEIKELFVRKTPFYFRGSKNAEHIGAFLNIEVTPGKFMMNLIQHLRLHLQCETFEEDMNSFLSGIPLVFESEGDRRSHGEHRMYDTYRRRLCMLRHMPYNSRKIKLEICIFHNLVSPHTWNTVTSCTRKKYNILEAVKPMYFHAKGSGADVSVRYENFSTGEGMDVTWELDMDTEAWEEVGSRNPVSSINIPLTEVL